MASDNLLSSLSAYVTIVAVPIALATSLHGAQLEHAHFHLPTSPKSLTTVRRDLWKESLTEFERWSAAHLRVDAERLPDLPYERGAVLGKRSYYRLRNPNVCPYPRSSFTLISEPRQTEYRTGPRTSNISGAVLEVQIIKPDIVILHLEGAIQKTFTKEYVQGLLGGYQPLLVDPQNASAFKSGDEARGGWRPTRACLWRSMDRVRLILESIRVKAFKDDANRLIAHFNGPPRIEGDEEEQQRFRAEWQPLLRYNPGRELESILPM
ncbi:uncharacterized protein P174DRAFT_515491 [Aspergillus novofumigatus IBT 16806]|uniref:Uncharacterized protein n=1 Tax=Aspergillus novofumigatus (strain IBT 16806) TaxID=1392255 RepID=A0A2I1BYC5_ASPN1|nr:uncharacterized protein P174DRAFT_515491 [Aspergillus novofumigatus IBT 16806]PKX90379.1 hypothetical protein P174DRAFT_515491 [Aspergillus novofumigatus IBT 16806]